MKKSTSTARESLALLSAATAARTSKRLRKFGPNPTCWRCGYQNPTGLVDPEAPTSPKVINIFEAHHAVGQHHDPELTIAVCRNCHAELTEALRAQGVPMRSQTSLAETLIAVLTALALFFRELADAFMRYVARLRTESLALDIGRNA